jgi:N-acetylglucosaminyl-diphospho-decaprenol L-rhamnosyltransferase
MSQAVAQPTPNQVMNNSQPELAIIIVSYNTQAMLRACLHSVYTGLAQTEVEGQVWVIDNASSDGSADMVRSEFPYSNLLVLTENRGFAAGNNAALRQMGFASPGPGHPGHVLFLNPDTELRGDALAQLLHALNSLENAGVVGARLVYPDGAFQHSAFHFPTLWQIWFDFVPRPARWLDSPLNGRYPRALYQAGQAFRIDHPLGAAMLTRSEVIQQVGLMDEAFFMYAEEVDWCMRVKNAGWDIYCIPAAQIVHYAGASTRQFSDRMFVALWRSRFRLFEKHYGPVFNLAARCLVRLGLRIAMRRAAQSQPTEAMQQRIAAYRQVRELARGGQARPKSHMSSKE